MSAHNRLQLADCVAGVEQRLPAVPSDSAWSSRGRCLNFISPKYMTADVDLYRLIFSSSPKPSTTNAFYTHTHVVAVTSLAAIRPATDCAVDQSTTSLYEHDTVSLSFSFSFSFFLFCSFLSDLLLLECCRDDDISLERTVVGLPPGRVDPGVDRLYISTQLPISLSRCPMR